MAVAAYDQSFSFRQDAVARLGDRAGNHPMSASDRAKFQNSPFMQRVAEVDRLALQKLSERDKKRAQNDRSFTPSDADFNAPKAYAYNTAVNYYKVLGVSDLATLDEVKKAYRKLSLTYHPDKTCGMSQEDKDSYAAIFVELKNAYKTLSDNPTRRQYDHERDRGAVMSKVNASQAPKDKESFDAVEALKKLAEAAAEKRLEPSRIIEVGAPCRLEKFVFGGHKAVRRPRQVKVKGSGHPPEFAIETRLYRIDVPQGSTEPLIVDFKMQGDQHSDRAADTLRFLVSPKPHEFVDRAPGGHDLVVKRPLDWGTGWRSHPYVRGAFEPLRGRHIALWGRNPFFHTHGSGLAELNVRIAREGAGPNGSLSFVARLGLDTSGDGGHVGISGDALAAGPQTAATAAAPSTAAVASEERAFLERHGLGPRLGFQASTGPSSAASTSAALQRRLRRMSMEDLVCELDFVPVGEPMPLFTKPPCDVSFYVTDAPLASSRSGEALSQRRKVPPEPMIAVCLSSPACAKRGAASSWEQLKRGIAPLLLETAFLWLRAARGIPPRRLATGAAPVRLDGGLRERPSDAAVAWKSLGNGAFRRGDYWQAMCLYSKALAEIGHLGDTTAREEAARLHSNHAACLEKLCDYEASLVHALRATELAPRWSKAWGRVGLAALKHEGVSQRAFDAYRRAVELEATDADVAALQAAAGELHANCGEAAHIAKEQGNEAARLGELARAVAKYTEAIARLPPAPSAEGVLDEHSLLRAILHTNRSAARMRLRRWGAAVGDGRAAVAAQPGLAKARNQLGASLLASGLHEEAYAEFARAVQLEPENAIAHKGRKACLVELLCWSSAPSRARLTKRFGLDARRPVASTRVFALSDLHFDHTANGEWIHSIDDLAFRDDILIVAGNIADTKVGVVRCLTTLMAKFRRVFYTFGNHELAVRFTDFGKHADSIAKLCSILAACDDLGVDVFPAPVCEGVFVVPLFSWYNAEFDEKDPAPNPRSAPDSQCRWPMDPDEQLWKYMLRLNGPHLQLPYHGTVITFSHFLPRRGLPLGGSGACGAKSAGCEAIDEQVRAVGSRLHVFGHSRCKYDQVHEGVRYVQMPLGYESERAPGSEPRLLLVYDGRRLCSQEWGADGVAPYGTIKRILRLDLLVMPHFGQRPELRRRVQAASKKLAQAPGVQADFQPVGSTLLTKQQFQEQAWPDLGDLSFGATHGLLAVADNVDALREWLHSDAYKLQWAPAAAALAQRNLVLNLELGVDLAPGSRADPVLALFALVLDPEVTEESHEFVNLQRAVALINALPGAAGRIAAAFGPLGFGGLSTKELLAELRCPEDKSYGNTHCLVLAADSPGSLKLLLHSKTFEKWKTASEACVRRRQGSPMFACVLPLDITATAAAPRRPANASSSGSR